MRRFEIHESLGRGGMAVVNRAVQRGPAGFSRTVALKRILPELACNSRHVERFIREAQLISELSHPGIVQVFDFGRDGHQYFIAMEHIDGWTLRQIHRARRHDSLPLVVITSVLRQLADALSYIHDYHDGVGGLVHRDVSPSNVMISSQGHLKLIDFGVATRADETQKSLVGKLRYIAPEAIAGAIDSRSDLWSLGVVAWELVTGAKLFSGASDEETLERVLSGDIGVASERSPSCPPVLDRLISSLLTRDPDLRVQRADEVVAVLDEFAARERLNISAVGLREWLEYGSEPRDTAPATLVDRPPLRPPVATLVEPTLAVPTRINEATAHSASMSSGFKDIGDNIVFRKPKKLRMIALAAVAALLALFVVRTGSQAGRASAALATEAQPPLAVSTPPEIEERTAPVVRKKTRPIRKKRQSKEVAPKEKVESQTPRVESAIRKKAGVLDGAVAALKESVPPPPKRGRPKGTPAELAASGPRVVSATAVKKEAGEMPPLRMTRNSLGGRESAPVSARICIDRRGRVASASVHGEVAKRIKTSLRDAIRSWRYQPFHIHGSSQPVCFFRRFRLVTPRRL